jgi:hypothetical protein
LLCVARTTSWVIIFVISAFAISMAGTLVQTKARAGKSEIRFRGQTSVQRSQDSLLFPPKATPEMLGFHSIVADEEYPVPSRKSPRSSRGMGREA